MTLAVAPAIIGVRILAIILSLALWFWTQALLARRKSAPNLQNARITDGLHIATASLNRSLNENPRRANALLISSSLVIDLLGFYLLFSAIFGPTIQPFLGLLILFALRQICQAFCPLPTPQGMIWQSPNFPALLVTYGTSNDLFFSGHTAIAIYGAATLAAAFGPVGIAVGILIALFEISAVIVLRAHYTMDVFAGAVTALYVHHLAIQIAPTLDQWLTHAAAMIMH